MGSKDVLLLAYYSPLVLSNDINRLLRERLLFWAIILSMLYEIILTIHLVGAALTGILASYAGVLLYQNRTSSYRSTSLSLGFLASFEILTGMALAVISTNISAPSLCANIGAYLLVVAVVEALIFTRMKKISMKFPFKEILTPIVASLSFFLAALVGGF